MNKLLIIALAAGCFFAATVSASAQSPADEGKYDEALAKKLGADEYGMRSYVFCVLKTGPAKIDDAAKRSEIFRGHFANMGRLAEEGKLVMAGPFGGAEPWRGMYIFNVETIDEATKLVETDPAVKAGIFVFELKKLYGSAALLMVNEIHTKIQKTKIE
jgi:uncharacterized protein YciI